MGRVEPTLMDGAMGTELARRGFATTPPAWSAWAIEEAPDSVADIHREYAAAGATLHTANTFRTQPRVVGPRWRELATRAVVLARCSVGKGQRVAGSVAPVEDCYQPDRSPGEGARDVHRLVAGALAGAGVDLLICETFAHRREAIVAVEECARTGLETWAALTAGPEASLLTPAAMQEAAADCVAAGARVVLVNCTPASATLPFVERLATLGVPFGAYANAGHPGDGLGWGADPQGAARAYARLARTWLDAGATVVGGCCGTGPAHVSQLARLGAFSARP